MFHPRSANWFDIMVPQSALASTLEGLAHMNAIELEMDADSPYEAVDLSDLRAGLDAYGELARRYRVFWPAPERGSPLPSYALSEVLADSVKRFQKWAAEAVPHIGALECAVRQQANLRHLSELAAAAGAEFPRRLLSGKRSKLFDIAVYLLEDGNLPQRHLADVYARTFETPMGVYFLAIGPHPAIAAVTVELGASKARKIDVREILDAIASNEMKDLSHNLDKDLFGTISAYIAAQHVRERHAQKALAKLSADYRLAQARANIERLRWLVDHVGTTVYTAYFVRITGWTALSQQALERTLNDLRTDDVRTSYAVTVGPPPDGLTPPLLLDNPAWVRPFETFVRLLGMPDRGEADPSPLVAVIAPLLFGFMFGDVGQGLVLLLAGLALRRRWPTAAILVPGGLFAMIFGFAFGTIFAREDVIGAMWLHPLVHPIPVLSVAIGAGVAILLTGMMLNSAGAHWQGRGRNWWATQAGLVVAYGGVLMSFATVWGQVVIGVGAVWFLLGTVLSGGASNVSGAGVRFGKAVGELIEQLFQLLINTLSFVRVGAFAIAHAGLSSAVMVLADIAGGTVGFWSVMIVGNVFIIALEGLVAGIQTTRLMLFEFFIRFLRAEGRPMRILQTPAAWSLKLEGKTT
ncbi:V-type ATPase 116kDa subunit family protein [Magnetovibrio sp.]|uniref:V-type ATPase 116kDa subunit family protein n=1 Tax=Magnetovibrio sp. TaxID=2024836 RepID=UPI002F955704